MAVTDEVKSKREAALARLKKKYPEESFEDDEAIFGRINDDYDAYDQELAGYREREGKFSDMFTSDPRSARLMMDWKNGDDPAIALIRLYGQDIKDAIDDPEKQEAIAEANKEYMERVSKDKEYEAEYSANISASLQMLEEEQAKLGLSNEQLDEAMQLIITISKDAMLGKFTVQTLHMALNALNYDDAVEQARTEGEVRGKNAKVTETLRKPQRGDGTAQLDGKNGGQGGGRMPDLGAIDRYDDGMMNIYERGGEKRTPFRN